MMLIDYHAPGFDFDRSLPAAPASVATGGKTMPWFCRIGILHAISPYTHTHTHLFMSLTHDHLENGTALLINELATLEYSLRLLRV